MEVEALDGLCLVACCVGLGLCRSPGGRGTGASARILTGQEGKEGEREDTLTLKLAKHVEKDIEQLAKPFKHDLLARRAQRRTRQGRPLTHRREREPVEGRPPEVEEDVWWDAGLRQEREEGYRRGEEDAREERGVVREGGADVLGCRALNQALDEACSRQAGRRSALRRSGTWMARAQRSEGRTRFDGSGRPPLKWRELDVERDARKHHDGVGRPRGREDVAEHLADLAGVALPNAKIASMGSAGRPRRTELTNR